MGKLHEKNEDALVVHEFERCAKKEERERERESERERERGREREKKKKKKENGKHNFRVGYLTMAATVS